MDIDASVTTKCEGDLGANYSLEILLGGVGIVLFIAFIIFCFFFMPDMKSTKIKMYELPPHEHPTQQTLPEDNDINKSERKEDDVGPDSLAIPVIPVWRG